MFKVALILLGISTVSCSDDGGPAGRCGIQAWGFVDGQVPGTDDPVLLSEYRLALLADTFTGPYMRPGEHH